MILLIDNYDSFTYNVYQLLCDLGEEVEVVKNDQITIAEIRAINPAAIVISPGPGIPSEAGVCLELVKQLYREFPIMGICLGHQTIAEAFGGRVVEASVIVHGKMAEIFHNGDKLFDRLISPFTATRYHSLIVSRKDFPNSLEILSWVKGGSIMALKHNHYPVYGVQFHPESIGTPAGIPLMQNFLKEIRNEKSIEYSA
ncbi:MAG: aminodeoxychorismate/anthranilate synthase component II [Halobacteriovoraceae bacterium]|jgi:anthranilate synthase component II|nr:aminodeoxychorismate/anthranilate synthase component II [Halobacteriovoraceae bacterium]